MWTLFWVVAAWLRERLAKGYEAYDVVVMNLGLAEAWLEHVACLYGNVMSSPQMAKNATRTWKSGRSA